MSLKSFLIPSPVDVVTLQNILQSPPCALESPRPMPDTTYENHMAGGSLKRRQQFVHLRHPTKSPQNAVKCTFFTTFDLNKRLMWIPICGPFGPAHTNSTSEAS